MVVTASKGLSIERMSKLSEYTIMLAKGCHTSFYNKSIFAVCRTLLYYNILTHLLAIAPYGAMGL